MKSPLSNEELCASARRGDASARNELIENNLGFIRKTANELWSSQRELNSDLLLDREDLEQEGALGLLRCVDTFDPESGVKFLSYAAPAVRNAMLDSIRERSRTFEAQNIGSRISLESAALYGTGKRLSSYTWSGKVLRNCTRRWAASSRGSGAISSTASASTTRTRSAR